MLVNFSTEVNENFFFKVLRTCTFCVSPTSNDFFLASSDGCDDGDGGGGGSN